MKKRRNARSAAGIHAPPPHPGTGLLWPLCTTSTPLITTNTHLPEEYTLNFLTQTQLSSCYTQLRRYPVKTHQNEWLACERDSHDGKG